MAVCMKLNLIYNNCELFHFSLFSVVYYYRAVERHATRGLFLTIQRSELFFTVFCSEDLFPGKLSFLNICDVSTKPQSLAT